MPLASRDVARRAEEFQRSQGRQIPPAMMPQLVDYMITDLAQLLQAQRLGLPVSDAELKDELQHGPLSTYIFPDGKFVGQEKYQNFVTQQLQSSVEHFEEQERNYILQRKVNYEPVLHAPDGMVKTEIRILFLWIDEFEKPKPVISVVRLSRGKMIGVNFNKDKTWVGGTVGFFEK